MTNRAFRCVHTCVDGSLAQETFTIRHRTENHISGFTLQRPSHCICSGSWYRPHLRGYRGRYTTMVPSHSRMDAILERKQTELTQKLNFMPLWPKYFIIFEKNLSAFPFLPVSLSPFSLACSQRLFRVDYSAYSRLRYPSRCSATA
jgi:hypothetical protein